MTLPVNVLKILAQLSIPRAQLGEYFAAFAYDADEFITGIGPVDGVVGPYLPRTWQDLNVPLQQGCTTRPVYRTYIDASAGDDSWDGSVPVWTSGTTGPKRTGVVANWTGTKTSWFSDEILLFAAGQIHTLTNAFASIGLDSYKHLGAYWKPDAPSAGRPIILSLNNAGAANSAQRACISASGTLTDISVSDLIIDASSVPNRCGLSFYQTAAGQSINNISIINVDVTGGTITDTSGYGGIKVEYFGQSSTLTAYPVSKNILIADCKVWAYPGHGFATNGTLGELLPNGRWHGVDLINCESRDNGAGYDTHAFTAYSGNVLLDWTTAAWTNTTGSIYWANLSTVYGRDMPDMDLVHFDTGASTEVFQLRKNTATPTTPAVGEFGFDKTGGTGNVRLYINAGLVPTITTRFSTFGCSVKGVRRIRCKGVGQVQAGRSGKMEGHAGAWDDGASYCADIECIYYDNAGAGVTLNRGNFNQVVACFIMENGLGPIKGNFGWMHYFSKNVLSGAGYSDTVPGLKGFVHIAHASQKAYGPNGAYTGALAAPNTFASISSGNIFHYTGEDEEVALLLGPTSGNAPPLISLSSEYKPGVAQLTAGTRTFIMGRSGTVHDVPNQIRGLGPQA